MANIGGQVHIVHSVAGAIGIYFKKAKLMKAHKSTQIKLIIKYICKTNIAN